METLKDFNRLKVNFRKSLVSEVLPEHFATNYPSLLTFIESYYDQLDSDGSYGGMINELRTIRDIEDTTLERLDLLFDEIALNVSQSQFTFPREAIRNFGNFFRVKGSEYSAHGFFRAFFNEEVEVIYPKHDLFIVGSSDVGPEQNKLLTDGSLYQYLSILIKAPLSIDRWEELYRRFVHPSGFYLGAQVVLEASPNFTITTDISEPDPDARALIVAGVATVTQQPAYGEVSDLYPLRIQSQLFGGLDSNYWRNDVYKFINNYGDPNVITMTYLQNYYKNLAEWSGFALTFDNANDGFGTGYMTYDNIVERFDQRQHQGIPV